MYVPKTDAMHVPLRVVVYVTVRFLNFGVGTTTEEIRELPHVEDLETEALRGLSFETGRWLPTLNCLRDFVLILEALESGPGLADRGVRAVLLTNFEVPPIFAEFCQNHASASAGIGTPP